MNEIFINANDEDFIIQLTSNEHSEKGEVYPINKYFQGGYGYRSQKDGSHLDSKEGANCFFHFSFCARGVWEGRIYFKDDEYWSEDLKTINILWDKIEVILKDRIKKRNPEWNYDSY
jgi:hypothetical protein